MEVWAKAQHTRIYEIIIIDEFTQSETEENGKFFTFQRKCMGIATELDLAYTMPIEFSEQQCFITDVRAK